MTAASVHAAAIRHLRTGATVLEGSYNRNVRVDDRVVGSVLVRMPKLEALPANLRTWPEPDIIRTIQKTADVPKLLYATPGFARREGDFQVHDFRHMTPLADPPAPVPDFLVERDIPQFFRTLAQITDLPATPRGWPDGTDAQGYADLQTAFLDEFSQHVQSSWPEMYAGLGFPDRPTAPVHQSLDGIRPVPLVPIHPDLWRGKMHLSDGGTVFIDHEFATIGDPRHALAYTLDEGGYTRAQETRLTSGVIEALKIPARGLEPALKGWTTWVHVQTALRAPARVAARLQTMTDEQADAYLTDTIWLRRVIDRVSALWGRPPLTHEQTVNALKNAKAQTPQTHRTDLPLAALQGLGKVAELGTGSPTASPPAPPCLNRALGRSIGSGHERGAADPRDNSKST